MKTKRRERALAGLLVGQAVGDAIGLPMEGLSPTRIARRFRGPLRHRLVLGHGMVSDDTDHALFVGQALLAHPSDVAAFRRSLAWKLRWWLVGLPPGIGLATLRAIAKLWLGLPRPGVYSAGNGPAMRAPLLGAVATSPAHLQALVEASTQLTHTDPKALVGALAVARAAAWAVGSAGAPSTEEVAAWLAVDGADEAWQALSRQLLAAYEAREDVGAFAARLGLARGVTGYMYHSVPVALYAWLRHFGDFAAAVEAAIALGGDTDSVAAVTGALAGVVSGPDGIPAAWRERILDWPRGERMWREVAHRLASGGAPVRYFWPGLALKNVAQLAVVLAHGFRRLAPW